MKTTCKYCHHFIDTTWDECPYCDVTEEEYQQRLEKLDAQVKAVWAEKVATPCTQDLLQQFMDRVLDATQSMVGQQITPCTLHGLKSIADAVAKEVGHAAYRDFEPKFDVVVRGGDIRFVLEPCRCLKCLKCMKKMLD